MPKTYSIDEVGPVSEIPAAAPGPAAPKATAPPEDDFSRVLRKAGEAIEPIGPMGLAGAGALKMAGRIPAAVRAGAGPVVRGATTLAEALTPQSLRQLGGIIGGAGLSGATGELARQSAAAGGAPQYAQQLAEQAGALAPTAGRMAVQRAAAPLVEAAGKRLYSVPKEIATPEKAQALQEAEQRGMRVLPGQIKESRPLQMVERMFQLLPGAKEEFVKFGRQNQEAANRAVAKAFGSTDPNVSAAAMTQVQSDLRKNYDDLLTGKVFTVDRPSVQRLLKIFSQNEELRDYALANAKVAAFSSALQAGQKIPAPLWKEVRSDLASYVYGMRDGSAKNLGRNVLEEFDNIARKNLQQDYEVLKGIDRKWSALQAFTDAFRRDPSIRMGSDVDINKFARLYASIEPENVLYGRTTGRAGEYVPLSQLAEQYKVFTKPRIPQTEATTLTGLARAGLGMSLFGGGLAFDLPVAGAAMAASPFLTRGMARAYLQPEETAKAMRQAQMAPYPGITAAQVPFKEER